MDALPQQPAPPATGSRDALSGRPLRWGIVGAGTIARALAEAVRWAPGCEGAAIAARDLGRAQELAEEFGWQRAHGSYDELWADPQVDVVYVATTHPFHVEQALAAIASGKHVLVEKPLALNRADAQRVHTAAREAGLFSMEAMWTACQPLVRDLLARVERGDLGRVVSVDAWLTVPFEPDPDHRLFDLANGGGALLDLGVYPAAWAHLVLGGPSRVVAMGTRAETGADDSATMLWECAGGATATLTCASRAHGGSRVVIRGEEGWIEVPAPLNDPTEATVHRRSGRRGPTWTDEPERVAIGDAGVHGVIGTGGYLPEVLEVERCIRAGLTESPLWPHRATLEVLGATDEARRQIGVRYPQEA